MGYNLWLSGDSEYTLGRRIGTPSVEAPAAPERSTDAPGEMSAAEMDHIDFLMETLARRLEEARPGS